MNKALNTKPDINIKKKDVNIPNDETISAIVEGRKIALDKNIKSFNSMDELKVNLESE